LLYYKDTPIVGVRISDIVLASTNPAVKTSVDPDDLSSVLGAAWDCCVVVRERLAMPNAAITKVYDAFKKSLGDEGFEKFLRPTAKVGLPPAK